MWRHSLVQRVRQDVWHRLVVYFPKESVSIGHFLTRSPDDRDPRVLSIVGGIRPLRV